MTNRYAVFVEGITDLQEVSLLEDDIRINAVRAINRIAAKTRTESARRIGAQVKFPSRYLNPAAKRLFVSSLAQRGSLKAEITARQRPTSLARFVVGTPRRGGQGVRVEVTPGRARYMRRAFLIKLPAGTGPIDTKFNMGLAVRLRPGEKLENKRAARRVEKGLYLLYGPSIDQVFLDNAGTGVADDIAPEALENLQDEFLRLMDL